MLLCAADGLLLKCKQGVLGTPIHNNASGYAVDLLLPALASGAFNHLSPSFAVE